MPARLLLLCLLFRSSWLTVEGGRGRRRHSAASPGRTGSRGRVGRRGWWRSEGAASDGPVGSIEIAASSPEGLSLQTPDRVLLSWQRERPPVRRATAPRARSGRSTVLRSLLTARGRADRQQAVGDLPRPPPALAGSRRIRLVRREAVGGAVRLTKLQPCSPRGRPRDLRRPEWIRPNRTILHGDWDGFGLPAADPMSLPVREHRAEIRRRHTLGRY